MGSCRPRSYPPEGPRTPMDAIRPGSIAALIVAVVLLGACSSPAPARPREATPEPVDSRPVLPASVAGSPGPPREGTSDVVDSRPVLPVAPTAAPRPPLGPPPTLAPALAL